MGCNQSKKIDPLYIENKLIERAQSGLNRGASVDNIIFTFADGDNNYYHYYYNTIFCDKPKWNKYYNLFDFMIKNGYLLKKDLFNYINIEHIKILNKYNYNISEYVQYLLKSENIDTLVKISNIYNLKNIKQVFSNTYASTKIYYVIALFLTKGYKLSDEEINYINLEFIEYIADHSAEEWMNNRSCRVCYKKLSVDTTPNLCVDCEN
jgi:hypothetical protein